MTIGKNAMPEFNIDCTHDICFNLILHIYLNNGMSIIKIISEFE